MSNGGRAYFTYTPRKYQTSYKWAEQQRRGGRERERERVGVPVRKKEMEKGGTSCTASGSFQI